MSKWAGKYVIGLTGNIGTGKSVVRRMLEHLGAYGIDADALAHRTIGPGAPGYQPVIDYFGRYILSPDGSINRVKLGRLVFNDAKALTHLEQIVHPLVSQAVDILVRRSPHNVVVIEAIKLLESELRDQIDTVWVVTVPPEVQLNRLIQERKMTETDALQRINAQPPQVEKITAADVVILNDGGFVECWQQVASAWKAHVPADAIDTDSDKSVRTSASLRVIRALPRNSDEITALFNRFSPDKTSHSTEDIMAAFGEKAFLLLYDEDQLRALIGWQVENLVASTTDFVIDAQISLETALTTLVKEMEKASKSLQCEVSLIHLPPRLSRFEWLWKSLGYRRTLPENLETQAWQAAAQSSMQDGTVLYFKKLRTDRILQPI